MNNPHQYEADSLRAQLKYTTDNRWAKLLREKIQSAERQAKIYEQKKRNEHNETKRD